MSKVSPSSVFLNRACIGILCVALGVVACSPAPSRAVEASLLSKARMEVHAGIPFLYLRGSDYEVGYQYARLLGDDYRAAFGEWSVEIDRMIDAVVKTMPGPARKVAPFVVRMQIRSAARALPPDIRDQLQGLADGSGIPFYDILRGALLTDLGCSAVIAIREGRVVHGRNFDQPQTPYAAHQVVVRYAIDGKIPYVSLGYAFLPFAITGFNDEGLAFSINAATDSRPSPSKGRDSFLALNNVLATCSTLDEVEAFLQDYHIPINHVLVYSSAREGRAALYDFVGEEHGRVGVSDVAYLANRLISPEMQPYETISACGTVREDAFARYAASGAPPAGDALVDWVIGALALTSSYPGVGESMVGFEQICNQTTKQSAVFDLSAGVVYLATGDQFAALRPWLRYDVLSGEVTPHQPESPILARPENQAYVAAQRTLTTATLAEDAAALRALRDELEASAIDAYWPLRLAYEASMELQDYPQAEAVAGRMVARYPDIAECYDKQATALESMGRLEEAARVSEEGLAAAQSNDLYAMRFHATCATWHASQGEEAEAAAHAQQALARYTGYWPSKADEERIAALQQIVDGTGQ
ncbi:MAG: hypothetical protein JXA74_04835 [Anaerolineae bacterium]|nr:hypothetical protein [Anaerolineae bacterium]